MLPSPAVGLNFSDEKRVNQLLLDSGANVIEINTVRNHISAIKGGRLALKLHPASIINFIICDELDFRPWGPTVPDETTFSDAINILSKYGILRRTPGRVIKYLRDGARGSKADTPKEQDFIHSGVRVSNFVLTDNSTICEAASEAAKKRGFNSLILTCKLEGESQFAGMTLGAIAVEAQERQRPVAPPCVLIAGGENTVRLKGKRGEGGPSQEFALGVAQMIDGKKEIVAISIDTDGTDGPTQFAGAIVDESTRARAQSKNIDILETLSTHNSSVLFRKLDDAIVTGITGTNVMDLNIVVIQQSLSADSLSS